MYKVCWRVMFLSLLFTTAVVQAETSKVSDERTEILLSKSERDLVLLEMRVFLQSVQQVISGVTEDDMEQVAKAARQSGRAAQQAVPASLAAKLPQAFKKLGFDTHSKFDELALNAEQLGDSERTLVQLKVLMENCVACHETFKFELEARPSN